MGQIPDKCNCFSSKNANNDVMIDQLERIIEGPGIVSTTKSASSNMKRTKTKKDGRKAQMKNFITYSALYPNTVVHLIVSFQGIVRGVAFRDKFKNLKPQLENETIKKIQELSKKFTTQTLIKSDHNPKHAYNSQGWKKFYKKEEKQFKIDYGKTFLTKLWILDNKTSIYSGSTNLNGKKHGFGVSLYVDGSKYEGFWFNNEFTGWGKHIDKEGNVYIGLFKQGKLNGFGEKFGVSGTYYQGEFQNSLKHGKGKDDNSEYSYEGQFKEDKKDGFGKVQYKKISDVYEGEFRDNSITGVGHYIWANGDSYSGPMIEGKMHGKGYYKWPDGSEYTGDYFNNIKEGVGKFKWANGRIFEGPFENGKPHGIGKLTVENSTFMVEFKFGKLTKSANKKDETTKDKK